MLQTTIKQQWERSNKTQRCFYFILWKYTAVTPHGQGIENREMQGLIHPDNLSQSGIDRAHSTVGLALVSDKKSPETGTDFEEKG